MLYKLFLLFLLIILLLLGFHKVLAEGIVPEVNIAIKEKPLPKEVFLASVSAYTASPDETDNDHNVTASGKVAEGNMVACPSRYEFGTIIEIKGKKYVCEDRMNKRYRAGNYFDILMETKAEAYNWGRRTVEVKVI